jgi:hypothetical protein
MHVDQRERSSVRDALFSVWFWRSGVAVWLILGVAFGLHRRWDYFALSVAWVLASVAGWSSGERHLTL